MSGSTAKRRVNLFLLPARFKAVASLGWEMVCSLQPEAQAPTLHLHPSTCGHRLLSLCRVGIRIVWGGGLYFLSCLLKTVTARLDASLESVRKPPSLGRGWLLPAAKWPCRDGQRGKVVNSCNKGL